MNLSFFVSDLKKIGLYILISSLIMPLFSQQHQSIFKPVDIAKVINRAEKELGNYRWGLSEYDYLTFGDTIVITPQGRHYVYLYTQKSDSFRRLDNSLFHGHNFDRQLIYYKGDMYAFGGYGFWMAHAKMIKFDWVTGEWDIIRLKGTKIEGSPQTVLHRGDSVIIYNTAVSNQAIGESYWTENKYIIDLKTMEVKQFTGMNSPPGNLNQFFSPMWNSQFSNYTANGHNGNIQFLVDKRTGKVYNNGTGPSISRIPVVSNRYFGRRNLSFLQGDSIVVVFESGEIEYWNIPEFIDLYCNLRYDVSSFEPVVNKEKASKWMLFIMGGSIMILTVIVVYILIRRERVKLRKWNGLYEEINKETNGFSKVRWLSSGTYSEKELDIALNIVHLPYDARKVKRSRELFKINEAMPGFIEKKENKKKPDQWVYQINNTA